MEKHTDRILWSVLILAIGVSLFVSFTPAGKNIISNVQDQLCFTGASQISDFDVSPKIVIKHDQLQTQTVTGDAEQLAQLQQNYNIDKSSNGSGLGVSISFVPKDNAAGSLCLVPNNSQRPMYLSLHAKYHVQNLTSLNDQLTYGLNNEWHTMIVEMQTTTADNTDSYDFESFNRCFSNDDLGKDESGLIYGEWKLPLKYNNARIARITMYIANLKADQIDFSDLNVGLWNGSIQYRNN